MNLSLKGYKKNETVNFNYNTHPSPSLTVNSTGFNSTFKFSKLFNQNDETFETLRILTNITMEKEGSIFLDVPISSLNNFNEGDFFLYGFQVKNEINDCLDVVDRCGKGLCIEKEEYGYSCNCDDTGYEGEHCEIEVNECIAWNPCTRNSKSCTDLINDFICECDIG